MPFNIFDAPVEQLDAELLAQKKLSVSVLRLDQIHPVVSGNKLFKLHYFLAAALRSQHKTILTFGGAYSNHLVATAFACRENDLKCIGIVRGEKPATLSPTLQQCMHYGMQLQFVARSVYDEKANEDFITGLQKEWGDCMVIPEGGYHPMGAKGAALIIDLAKEKGFTHICTATGTATTVAGLLLNNNDTSVISVPVLKGMTDIEQRIHYLTGGNWKRDRLEVLDQYHFGGYAKKTPELLAFMNRLWQEHRLPTDFVYTAKLFYAVFDRIKNDRFPEGSQVLCLHTGGLQGNNSLPEGSLLF
ncbi:1-aminocyclopropane-1-carboxylate deaminase/D-cysteine desulfhydrase [Ferruginibacter sp.]